MALSTWRIDTFEILRASTTSLKSLSSNVSHPTVYRQLHDHDCRHSWHIIFPSQALQHQKLILYVWSRGSIVTAILVIHCLGKQIFIVITFHVIQLLCIKWKLTLGYLMSSVFFIIVHDMLRVHVKGAIHCLWSRLSFLFTYRFV